MNQRNYVEHIRQIGKECAADLKRTKPKIKRRGRLEKMAFARFYADVTAPPRDASWRFDEDRANAYCAIAERLSVPDMGDGYFVLHDYQILVICSLFGFLNDKNGPRFDVFYIEIARGGGKSAFAALILVLGMVALNIHGAQYLVAATTRDQARHVFDKAKKIIERTPTLSVGVASANDFHVTKSYVLAHKDQSSLKAVSSEKNSQEGWGPTIYIIDELHAHRNREIYDVMLSSKGKSPFSVGIYITTAGDNNNGICYEERQMAINVLNGTAYMDHYFVFIATLDDEKSWNEEWAWYQANPTLGRDQALLEAIRKKSLAAGHSLGAEAEFKRKHCNFWIEGHNRWLSATSWDAASAPDLGTARDLSRWKGSKLWIGVDLSTADDLTALSMVFLNPNEEAEMPPIHVITTHYSPRENINRKIEAGMTFFKEWVVAKEITVTEGSVIDWDVIERDIMWIAQNFWPEAIVFDQYVSATPLIRRLRDVLGEKTVHIVSKSKRNVSPAAHNFEARVNAILGEGAKDRPRLITHCGNPVMRWNVTNVVVSRGVDDSIIPKKESEHSQLKIDGVDATIHAIAAMLDDEEKFDIGGFNVFGTGM